MAKILYIVIFLNLSFSMASTEKKLMASGQFKIVGSLSDINTDSGQVTLLTQDQQGALDGFYAVCSNYFSPPGRTLFFLKQNVIFATKNFKKTDDCLEELAKLKSARLENSKAVLITNGQILFSTPDKD